MAFLHKLIFLGLISIGLIYCDDNDGICNKTWTSPKLYRETYIRTWYHTYWGYCGWERCVKRQLKSRVEDKIKYEDVVHKLEFCCNNYERVASNPLTCHPKCSPSCVNGNCTEPGKCTCYSGYKPKSSYECEPICEPPCENAVCTDHNVCDCLDDYKPDKDLPHKCNPICTKDCQNGFCSLPNTCKCKTGYKLSEEDHFICLPICDNCINSDCTEPNVCTCFKGYNKVNVTTCEPFCSRECIRGQCTSPEKCTCDQGHILSSNVWNLCKPYCSKPCFNSFCSEPEICTCYENYSKVNNFLCEPICKEICKNSKCVAPDVCKCNDGYKPILNETNVCQPNCTYDCINSNCIGPNNCKCFEGYEKSEFDVNVCEPFCNDGCLNGNCTLPNVCTCDTDFIKVRHNVCMPICNEDCQSNFELCKLYNPECIQIGRHFFQNDLFYTTNEVSYNDIARLTLNWTCNDIFNITDNSQSYCTLDKCDSCSSLPLSCISEINLNDNHIDFICSKQKSLQNFTKNKNNTDFFIKSIGEEFNYSLTLIHPEELYGAEKGKCNVCLCGTNLKSIYDQQNEAIFYFTPCPRDKESLNLLPADNNTPFVYLFAVITVIIVLIGIILAVYFFVPKHSSSYGVRKEQNDDQELTVEQEFLVATNNIHEDD